MNRIVRYALLVFMATAAGYYVITKFVIHRDPPPLQPGPLGPVGRSDTGALYDAEVSQAVAHKQALQDVDDIVAKNPPTPVDDTPAEVWQLRERLLRSMAELARKERELQRAQAAQRELRQSLDQARNRLDDAEHKMSMARASEETTRARAELLDQQRSQLEKQQALIEQELAILRVRLAQAEKPQTAASEKPPKEQASSSRPRITAEINQVGIPARISIPVMLFQTPSGLRSVSSDVSEIAAMLKATPAAKVRIELPDAPSVAIASAAPGDTDTPHTKAARHLRDQLIADGVPPARIRFTGSRSGGLGVGSFKPYKRVEKTIDLVIER